ncbi:CU044_2847 family protein [Streptomyces sp. NPDC048483]|uniref:CU044_2847 family protein n=1 Tax=Streptomyces sp. NPDC048483 TaxID=3154927 RepID=UPI0034199B04
MRLIAVPLNEDDKEPTVFESDIELTDSDLELAAGSAGVVARARVSLDDAMAQVRPTLARVVETVRELGPDEAEIEFGLKIGGDTTVIIAKGTAEVNFAIRLKWQAADPS